jgi:hypothetical protein
MSQHRIPTRSHRTVVLHAIPDRPDHTRGFGGSPALGGGTNRLAVPTPLTSPLLFAFAAAPPTAAVRPRSGIAVLPGVALPLPPPLRPAVVVEDTEDAESTDPAL